MDINESMNVTELKTFLDEYEVDYTPYTQEEIKQRLETLNLEKFPKLVEDYLLKIGWMSLIEDAGMGNAFYELNYITIETSESLKHYWGDVAKNETDDYLCIGGESVGVNVFYIRVKDFDEENPAIYGRGDSNINAIKAGYAFGPYEDWETLKNFLGLIAFSVEDCG